MYRVFEHSQVVLSGFQCMYVIHEAHQNEIYETNFDTAVLLRLRRHKQHITFCELAMRFSLCENKKAKYDDNVPFDFPFFNERQTKTTQSIKKLFLLIDS